jgi:hypothetical protein
VYVAARLHTQFSQLCRRAQLTFAVVAISQERKGPISTRVTVRTQRGQEYSTGVVINSKTPQACVCVCVCVRACVRACVCVRARACVHLCV